MAQTTAHLQAAALCAWSVTAYAGICAALNTATVVANDVQRLEIFLFTDVCLHGVTTPVPVSQLHTECRYCAEAGHSKQQ